MGLHAMPQAVYMLRSSRHNGARLHSVANRRAHSDTFGNVLQCMIILLCRAHVLQAVYMLSEKQQATMRSEAGAAADTLRRQVAELQAQLADSKQVGALV